MEKSTLAFERNNALCNLLASLHSLHDLNIENLSNEESEEFGWRIFNISQQLIISFIKSFEPETYKKNWFGDADGKDKKVTSKRKK